jgi:hypothetical protein
MAYAQSHLIVENGIYLAKFRMRCNGQPQRIQNRKNRVRPFDKTKLRNKDVSLIKISTY